MPRGYVQGRWGQVHYRAEGESGPAVLLVHESPLSSEEYRLALPELGKSVRAVAFDTPGYGQSDPPPAPQEIPEYAASLLEAADALGLDEFAVVGTHTGASIAVQMAVQAAPGRVTHAILSGIPVMRPETRAHLLATWAPETPPQADGSHFADVWGRYVAQGDPPPDFITTLACSLFSVWERYHWAYNAAFRYDPAPDLPALTCPTLFLTAASDLLLRADERALKAVPDGRLTVVEGRSHPLPWCMPERFASEIAAFVGAG
jgi:pimeloyl-ACP methyl ester carboxylesterase